MMTRALATSVSLALCLGAFGCELLLGKNDYELGSSDAGAVANGDGGATSDALPTADAAPDAAPGSLFLQVLATGQNQPRGLALDTDRVYWANLGDGTISFQPKTANATTPPTLVTDAAVTPRWVALDATQIFWPSDTNGGCVKGVLKASKDLKSGPTQLAGCTDFLDRINGFGVDGTFVYWTTHPAGTALFAVSKEGGQLITLASGLGGQPDALAIAPDAVYFNNPPLQTVTRYDKAAQTVQTIAAGHAGLTAIATDGTYVYFATAANVLRTLGSTSVDAGATAEMIATGQDGPAGVAVFGDYVYFTASGASTVNRVRKTGGAVEVIAKNQIGARAVVADESGVYFSRDTGEIVRLAP